MLQLILLVLICGCAGCAFDPEVGLMRMDPFHLGMQDVNAQFRHDPIVRVPTAAGNLIGIAAGAPIGLPFLLLHLIPGPPAWQDATALPMIYPAASLSYLFGGLLGAPFLGIDLAFVHWWSHQEEPEESGD